VRWKFARAWAKLLPPEVKMPTPDRDVLERVIFRDLFCDPHVTAMLFVGCAGYSAWYPRLFRFRPGFRFATVDPDPEQESFGARGDHRAAKFESLADAPEEHGRFDLVCLNGVFGYGVDTADQQREALRTAFLLLRPGGRLLVGDDDGGSLDRSLIDAEDWSAVDVPGLRAKVYATGSKLGHQFSCYRRP
jgi:SAM-dependent methyltransferase